MISREKAAWLTKANPYKQPDLWDAFREGARAYWAGRTPEYRGNSRMRAAFNKGHQTAWDQEFQDVHKRIMETLS